MSEWHTIDRTGVERLGGIHIRVGFASLVMAIFPGAGDDVEVFSSLLQCPFNGYLLSCCQKPTRSVTCVRDGWSPSEWLLTEVPRRGCGAHPARVLNRLHCFGSNLGGGACRLMTEWRVLVLAPLTKMQRCSSWMHLVSPSL